MPSDAQLTKRDKYLAEGKIKVMEADERTATVFAQGSGDEPYVVRFRANSWSCTCPAQKPECVHVLAAMQVSPLRSRDDVQAMDSDPEIDAILAGDLNLDELLGTDTSE
jgi:uncharacterized Zn finger protein